MEDYIEIVYHAKYGTFLIPIELKYHLNIENEKGWNIRTNKKLIELVKNIHNNNKECAYDLFVNKYGIANDQKTLYYAMEKIKNMKICKIQKKAYDCGAIHYNDYDGLETITIDENKMNLLNTRELLEEFKKDLSSEKLEQIERIIETIPRSFQLPIIF